MQHQGEALQKVLSNRGINITELSAKLKVSRTTIYNWFTMMIVPYENLEQISDKIGLDVFDDMRQILQKKDLKFYKPIKTEEPVTDQRLTVNFPTMTQILLAVDGTEETLKDSIRRLQTISRSLATL